MKLGKTAVAAVGAALMFAGAALAQNDGIKGNGLPQTKLLFNLQVIAYDGNNCPQGSLTDGGHRIAVKANVTDNPNGQTVSSTTFVRQNDIMLAPGADFAVLDGNACVDGVARFQLPPNPFTCSSTDPQCLDTDPTFQEYQVFARLVGKPGTGVDVTTCATGPGPDGDLTTTADNTIVCSTESWVSVRQKGTKPQFTNVSKELLTICTEAALLDGNPNTVGDGVCDLRLALFDSRLYDYFWNWNTTGKAHAQLFFMALPD